MAMATWLPGLLSAVQGGVNTGMSVWNTIEQIQANKDNLRYQDEWNRLNRQMTLDINQKNIDHQTFWNNQNRNWSLEDWNRQNQYNDPKNQMARLKAAGLNPHLVYGNGAQTTAAPIASPTAKAPQEQAFQGQAARSVPGRFEGVDFTGPIMDIYSLRRAGAETDNIEKTGRLLDQRHDMVALEMAGMITKNARSEFDLGVAKDLRDSTLMRAKLDNDYKLAATAGVQASTAKTITDTQLAVPEFQLKKRELDMKQAKTNMELQQATAEYMKTLFELNHLQPAQLKRLNQEIDNMVKSGRMQQLMIQWREAGLNPNDPTWQNVVAAMAVKVANMFGANLKELPTITNPSKK